jgi:hypothetical protein
MVLWSNGERLRVGFKKMRMPKRKSAKVLSKEGAGEASNLMWRPVHLREPERNHIRLRGVGFG